jgi:hypothetical protein
MVPHLLFFAFLLLLAPIAAAQDEAHWGAQGDYFRGAVPGFIVDQIEDLPERPQIDGEGFNTGLVRFHGDGSPNWAVDFSKIDLTLAGGMTTGPVRQEVRGNGTARGAIFTKFLNFFSTRYISGGVATGIGLGNLEASYIRYQVPPGSSIITGGDSIDRVVPLFQATVQADFRPVRWISLSPFYGLRNGTLGGGGAIRIHFTR